MHQKVILDSIISDEDGTISEIQVVIDAIQTLQTTTAQGLAPAEFNNFLSSLCEVSEVNPSLRKTIVSLLCMTSARQTDEGLLRFDESGMIDRLMTELSRYNFDGLPRKGSVLANIKVKLRDNLKTDNGALAENIGRLDNYVDDYVDDYVEYNDDFEQASPNKDLVVGYPDDDKDFLAAKKKEAIVIDGSEMDSIQSPVEEPIVNEIKQQQYHQPITVPNEPIIDMNSERSHHKQSPPQSPQGMMMRTMGTRTFLTGLELETNDYHSKPYGEMLDIPSPTKPIERRRSIKTIRRLELKRNCDFIPNVIYEMLDALREKAQIAEEVIITAEEHWRQRMVLSLEESLQMLKKRHGVEQQGVVEEYRNCVDECTRNIMSWKSDGNCKITKEKKEFLDSLNEDKLLENLTSMIAVKKDSIKSRYRAIRSSLVKRQQCEVEDMTKALIGSLSQLDSIRNAQLQNIHSALHKAEKATEHCIPLAETAHKAPYNKLLQNRSDHGIQNARIAIGHAMELVATECSKIRKNYKTVHNVGPIEHCLANPTRPSSAYPGLIFTDRLPAMPSCVVRHRPSSSKRPTTGMSRYLKKSMTAAAAVHVSKSRPKSAPNLTKPMREVYGISSIQQRTSQQRPSSSGKANTDRPISATGLKIKTRMQALREAAQQQQQIENDKENIAANDNNNDIDDEIYDEEFDSDEDKVFENSIQEMQKSKYESQSGEKMRQKIKKKRKKMKRISSSTITDSYDAMEVQRLCLQCKRKYFGDGKAIPSISSLDRHVSLNMRVKEIVGKREAIDLLTSTERLAHERRERNKKVYSMKIEKIEKFCSWECVKAKSLVAVPKAFRYEVFQLIDLYAGYIVN